jgi:hypothetical protein
MEKISWTDRVRNGEVLRGVKEKKNIPHTGKIRNDNSVGHMWRRNCRLKDIIEGKIE